MAIGFGTESEIGRSSYSWRRHSIARKLVSYQFHSSFCNRALSLLRRLDAAGLQTPYQKLILSYPGVWMARSHTYPLTRYEPSPLIDLTKKTERERLSSSALGAFFNIMEQWKVRDDDARALLGGISNGPFYELKKNRTRVLDADRLQRISYLVGIFKALNILYSEKLADTWVTRPNTHRIFAGLMPLEYMTRGGLPAMQVVRRLLDARRGAQ